jgi:hypothetical protein
MATDENGTESGGANSLSSKNIGNKRDAQDEQAIDFCNNR